MTSEVEIHGVRMRAEVYARIKGGVPPDYTEEEFSAYSAIALAKERAAAAGPKMEGATCRGCRRPLFGKDYCFGGRAYVPDANGKFTYREAKKNYYGGFVCSRSCDFRSSLELEQSMPGHGYDQKSLGQAAQRSLEANWDRP